MSDPVPALDDPAVLVEAFEQVVRNALAPVVERLRSAEALAGTIRNQLEVLAAAPPTPGPPGDRGLGLDSVEYDGERTLTFTWGDIRIPVRLPAMIYRGVWLSGKSYERGDCVTIGGSIYHANADTSTRPGELAQAWTLAVKHGHPR